MYDIEVLDFRMPTKEEQEAEEYDDEEEVE